MITIIRLKLLSCVFGLLLVLCLNSTKGFSKEQVVHMITFEYSPVSIVENDNKISGIGPEILRAMVAYMGVSLEERSAPTKRAILMLEKEPLVLPVLTRTPSREDKYHWIGMISEDENCFIVLKDNPPINSLDDAKKLNRVGVNAGGRTFKYLGDRGFTNLDPTGNNKFNVRKLFTGRIDAWFSSKLVAHFTMKSIGFNPDMTRCLTKTQKIKYYIVASKKISPDLLKRLKNAFAALQNNGKIDEIRLKYM